MKKVSCVGLIPAEYTVARGQSLNVMVMAVGAEVFEETAEICIYGETRGRQKLLTSKTYLFPPEEHAHLYFQIPRQCFTPEFWDGHSPEEMTLYTGTRESGPIAPGKLVFLEEEQ